MSISISVASPGSCATGHKATWELFVTRI